MELWFWIVVAIGTAVVEAATVQLVSVWFVGGALAAIVVKLLGGPLWAQVLAFALVTLALLLLLRPILKRYLNKNTIKTNVEALAGRRALVIERIDNLQATGHIKLDGADWTARSIDGTVIEAGTEVVIRSVQGVKALVEKL